MSVLLAVFLCACASGLPYQVPADQHVEDELSLVQASIRVKGKLSSQRHRNEDVPALVVDLDVAPELRWRNVTRYYMALGVLPQHLYTYNITDPALQELAQTMEVEEEHVRELRGMVADMGLAERYVYLLILANSGYELSGFRDGPRGMLDSSEVFIQGCSGILAAMPNGTVVHGRNMDYHGFRVEVNGRTLLYPDVTVEVVFMRNGKPLFTSVNWPGHVGIHTAMRFGGWSFEQNTRMHFMDSSILYGLFRDSQGFMLAARNIMETTPDFETAVQRLGELNLMAPGYFIVAGPGAYEGAVITMDRGGSPDPSTPLVRRLSSSPARRDGQVYTDWNIIQTNDDLNQAPLDMRRPAEELKLAWTSQGDVSADWMFRQLTAPPLFNGGTVFTAVYIPATGYQRISPHWGHDR